MNFYSVASGKILPKMASGGKRLLFSETVCFLENDGIELSIPSGSDSHELKFLFDFTTDETQTQGQFKINSLSNSTIKFSFTNFNNPLGIGTTSPVEFTIGNKKHWFLIYASGLTNQNQTNQRLINMTISMYREGT